MTLINHEPVKILLVEDQLSELIQSLLEKRNGYDFTIVDNGRSAVIAELESNYDCIIMDLLLPEMSGIRAIKHIREFNQDVPIIALSAVGNFEERAIEAGANAFIWKPPDYSYLHLRIYELVIQYKQKQIDTILSPQQKIKKAKTRRLLLLKEIQAKQGVNVDPAIVIEIEDLEEELSSSYLDIN